MISVLPPRLRRLLEGNYCCLAGVVATAGVTAPFAGVEDFTAFAAGFFARFFVFFAVGVVFAFFALLSATVVVGAVEAGVVVVVAFGAVCVNPQRDKPASIAIRIAVFFISESSIVFYF